MGFWSMMKSYGKTSVNIVRHPPIHINTGKIVDFGKKEYGAGLGKIEDIVSEVGRYSRTQLKQDKIEKATRGVVTFNK